MNLRPSPSRWLALAFAAVLALPSLAKAVAADEKGPFILATPTFGYETLLLNDEGKVEKIWKSTYRNAGGARLLPDSSLLRVIAMPLEKTFSGSGVGGGGIELMNSKGEVQWRFWNAVTHHMTFGDAVMLPNGNVLTAVLEWKSREEAEKAGRNVSSLHDQGLLVPGLMEFKPKGEFGGLLVWKWSLWNHIYQGRHPALPNYSFPNAKPGCIDINAYGDLKRRKWVTPHQIDYNAAEDLIVVSVRELGEVWVIDHSTGSNEAAGEEGGKRARGGRILQRIGTMDETNRLRHVLVGASWSIPDGIRQSSDLELMRLDGSLLMASRAGAEACSFKINEMPIRKFGERKDGKFIGLTKVAAPLPGGGGVFTTGIHGAVARTTETGGNKWVYQNTFGKMHFAPRDTVDEEVCCGGSKSSSANPVTKTNTKPKGIDAAPIDRLRIYPTTVLASDKTAN